MDDVYVGEIRAVIFNYAPPGWAICNGATLQIRSYTALFSILGVTYGGDGRMTFNLPDLRSRAIVNFGLGTGLSQYSLGIATGAEQVKMDVNNIPPHVHGLSPLKVNDSTGTDSNPANNLLADSADYQYGETSTQSNLMADKMIVGSMGPVGGGQPHSNLMPYTVVNYIIALTGVFPVRS